MDKAQEILLLLERALWPMPLQRISDELNLPAEDVAPVLEEMRAAGRIVADEHGCWRIAAQEVVRQIAAFLDTRFEAEAGGWPQVDEADVATLLRLFDLVIDAKWGRDVDGDTPICVQVCDRTRQEFVNFRYPPRYWDKGDAVVDEDAFRQARDVCWRNLRLAFGRLETLWQVEQHARIERQEGG